MRILLALLFLLSVSGEALGSGKTSPGNYATDERYLRLEPIAVSVLRENGVRGIITIILRLELKSLEERQRVSNVAMRIQDAYIVDLTSLLSFDHGRGKDINLELLRRRLLARARSITGGDSVSSVLFDAVYERVL